MLKCYCHSCGGWGVVCHTTSPQRMIPPPIKRSMILVSGGVVIVISVKLYNKTCGCDACGCAYPANKISCLPLAAFPNLLFSNSFALCLRRVERRTSLVFSLSLQGTPVAQLLANSRMTLSMTESVRVERLPRGARYQHSRLCIWTYAGTLTILKPHSEISLAFGFSLHRSAVKPTRIPNSVALII
jgi:hypothetical protein